MKMTTVFVARKIKERKEKERLDRAINFAEDLNRARCNWIDLLKLCDKGSATDREITYLFPSPVHLPDEKLHAAHKLIKWSKKHKAICTLVKQMCIYTTMKDSMDKLLEHEVDMDRIRRIAKKAELEKWLEKGRVWSEDRITQELQRMVPALEPEMKDTAQRFIILCVEHATLAEKIKKGSIRSQDLTAVAIQEILTSVGESLVEFAIGELVLALII